jgi:hypothetical protein
VWPVPSLAAFRATYRLQLGPNLDFRGARALVPYLRELGVSHLYLSPVIEARAGSTHGYDVVDPTSVSEALGREDELRRLCTAGLGVVLDVVPNHMATSRVLALGVGGDYEPVDAGPDVCAFVRGGRHLVAAPLRRGARFEPPAGWRPVVSGLYSR